MRAVKLLRQGHKKKIDFFLKPLKLSKRLSKQSSMTPRSQFFHFKRLLFLSQNKLLEFVDHLFHFEIEPKGALALNCAFLTEEETASLGIGRSFTRLKFVKNPEEQVYLGRKFLTFHVLRQDRAELLSRMLDRGFPLSYLDHKDPTNLLFSILERRSLACLNVYIDRGLNTHSPSLTGRYPLVEAAQFAKNPRTAKLLERLVRASRDNLGKNIDIFELPNVGYKFLSNLREHVHQGFRNFKTLLALRPDLLKNPPMVFYHESSIYSQKNKPPLTHNRVHSNFFLTLVSSYKCTKCTNYFIQQTTELAFIQNYQKNLEHYCSLNGLEPELTDCLAQRKNILEVQRDKELLGAEIKLSPNKPNKSKILKI